MGFRRTAAALDDLTNCLLSICVLIAQEEPNIKQFAHNIKSGQNFNEISASLSVSLRLRNAKNISYCSSNSEKKDSREYFILLRFYYSNILNIQLHWECVGGNNCYSYKSVNYQQSVSDIVFKVGNKLQAHKIYTSETART